MVGHLLVVPAKIMWKCFANSNTLPENLEQAVSSESAYEDILEHLLYDAPTPIQKISETTGDRASRTVALSEIERQRRAAAICACENSRRWRCHFRSKVEYITLFWAQYRYYLVSQIKFAPSGGLLSAVASKSQAFSSPALASA